MKSRPMILAGVSAALLAAVAWMLQFPKPSEGQRSKTTNTSSKNSASSPELTDSSARRERRAQSPAPRHDAGFTRHDAGKLVNFILPKVEGKDVTLPQALAILKEAYQDACFRSREKALDLKFTIKDDPGGTIRFSLKGKSFIASLNHIAALAGLEATRNATDIALFRSASADQAAEMDWRRPATTINQLKSLAGQISDKPGLQDPFADPGPEQGSPTSKEDWETLLRSTGILLEDGTVLATNADGTLHISGSTAEINRVKSALELVSAPNIQIKISNRLITTDTPIDINNPNLTADENAALLRELASRAGTTLTAEPTFVARDGENAKIEIIRQRNIDNLADWTGLRHEISVGFTGLKLVGSDKSQKRPESADESGWLSENEFALYPGETHVQLVSSGNGGYQYRLLTAIPIDATGRPLNGAGDPTEATEQTSHPTASRVPDSPRFVFSPFNHKLVDVEGIPSGTLVADPTYPAAEKKMFRVP